MSDSFGKKRGLREAIEDMTEDMVPEALEDNEVFIDDDDEANLPQEDFEEGDDLMERIDRDYRAIPALDQYEDEGVDNEDVSHLSYEARRRADREIDIRNRESGRGRIPAALLNDTEGSLYSDGQDMAQEYMHRRDIHYNEYGVEGEGELDEVEQFMNADEGDDGKGKVEVFIKDPKTAEYIKKTFRRFLLTFIDEKNVKVYENRITEMCSKNMQSIELTYFHMTRQEPTLAYWLFEAPAHVLPIMNSVSFDVACKLYPGYENIHSEIYVKIRDFPLSENLRDLRTYHLNTLIKIQGVITRRYPVYSQLKKIFYICRCGDRKGPIFQNDNQDIPIGQCGVCHSNGPFEIDSETTVYRNYQKITVQESPGTVLPGRVPRHKDAILLGDNIDYARPGDEVEIIGIYSNKFDYSMNVKHGFPVFSTIIEANSVRKIADMNFADLTNEDKAKIYEYSRKSNITRILVNSIAPSIYGHHHIKTAIALSMFGGERQNINGSHTIRGDINVLLLGDPGLAKSQFLKYVEQTFHRTVYTTGKGASAVGLTASVRRDFSSKEWTLEGGAMVLADQGICLIDEFDKMSEMDRTSIHEAMEQQSISISKAGIVATLQARCAVIAAANPIKGRYDRQLSFSDNVNLSEPILSRFDILCVLKDNVDMTADSDLATFIINSHMKNHPNFMDEQKSDLLEDIVNTATGETMTQDLLKKYIIFSRMHVHPKLTKTNVDKISNFYSELRRESQTVGGLNIVIRHIESLIRMAQASARMHLRSEVRSSDIDLAISVLLESFIQSQKVSIGKVIKKKFSSYISFKEDLNSILMQCIGKLFKEQLHYLEIVRTSADHDLGEPVVSLATFSDAAKEINVYDISTFMNSDQFQKNFVLHGDNIRKRN